MSSSIGLLTLYQINNGVPILPAQKDELPPAAREALEQVDQCNYHLYLHFLTFQ